MTVPNAAWKSALLGLFLLLFALGAGLTLTARSKEKKTSPKPSFPQQSEYAGGDACFACHLKSTEDVSNFLRNEHGLNSVACTNCHSVHANRSEPLLKARTPAL